MKSLRLSTIFLLFLFFVLLVSFEILLFFTVENFKEIKNITVSNSKLKVSRFIDYALKQDVLQQANLLNTSISHISDDLFLYSELLRKVVTAADTNPNKLKATSDKEIPVPENKLNQLYQVTFLNSKPSKKTLKAYSEIKHILNLFPMAFEHKHYDKYFLRCYILNLESGFMIDFFNERNGNVNQKHFKDISKTFTFVKSLNLSNNKPAFDIRWNDHFKKFLIDCYIPIYIKKKLCYVISLTLSEDLFLNQMYDFFEYPAFKNYGVVRFLSDTNGDYLFFPYNSKNSTSLNKKNKDYKLTFREAVQIINHYKLSKGFEVKTFKYKSVEYLAIYKSLPINNWKFCILVNKNDLYHPVRKAINESNEILNNIYYKYILTFILIVLSASVLSFILFKKLLIKPFYNILTLIKPIGKGEFNFKLESTGPYEMRELSSIFNNLSKELKEYKLKLSDEIKDRQAVDTELKIAAKLQKSCLPALTNEYNSNQFDLYAKLNPAKFMSGDFYDFFFIDEEHIAFAIGDVCGKGISAAFYMSMSKAIIKEQCLKIGTGSTGKIISKVNDILCDSVKSPMFLTLFFGIYNIKSGVLLYTNAGHEPPVHSQPGRPSISLGQAKDTFIGYFKQIQYSELTLKLNKGDSLTVYTDGVTEAMDSDGVPFGQSKLIEYIDEIKDANAESICTLVVEKAINFQSKAIFDDIAVLTIRRTN